MMCRNVDVVVIAFKPHEKPHLPLTTIFAAPDFTHQLGWQIVEMLLAALRDNIDQIGSNAGFFCQFAQSCSCRIFPIVDPALWHLPCIAFGRLVDPLTDKYLACHIGEHDPGTRTIGEIGDNFHASAITSASIAFNAARFSTTSCCADGIALRKLM